MDVEEIDENGAIQRRSFFSEIVESRGLAGCIICLENATYVGRRPPPL